MKKGTPRFNLITIEEFQELKQKLSCDMPQIEPSNRCQWRQAFDLVMKEIPNPPKLAQTKPKLKRRNVHFTFTSQEVASYEQSQKP